MVISHHIAAALASERERDLVAGARRRHRRDADADAEAAREAPFFTPAGSARPSPAPERDGRLALRISRARGVEADHSANARARERVSAR